jgi:hypothetical protein
VVNDDREGENAVGPSGGCEEETEGGRPRRWAAALEQQEACECKEGEERLRVEGGEEGRGRGSAEEEGGAVGEARAIEDGSAEGEESEGCEKKGCV